MNLLAIGNLPNVPETANKQTVCESFRGVKHTESYLD